MAKLSKQEQEWGRMFDNSTNPQEIMELALKLGMEPFTLQEATEAAERHARIIARRTEPNELEKGFTELLLEAESTEDLKKKESLYAKIVEREIKHVQEGSNTIEF